MCYNIIVDKNYTQKLKKTRKKKMKVGNTVYYALDWYDEDSEGNVVDEGIAVIKGDSDEELYEEVKKVEAMHTGFFIRPAYDSEVLEAFGTI